MGLKMSSSNRSDYSKEYVRRSDTRVEVDLGLKSLLIGRGIPKSFLNFPAFSLQGHTTSFVSETEFTNATSITSSNQVSFVSKIIENPWFAPYIFCVSSMPNDMRAKSLVAFLLSIAIRYQLSARSDKSINLPEKTIRKIKLKSLPLFDTFNGFESQSVKNHEKPSLIVLSNVTINSTQHRIERLRDTLEHYSDIPRIVCISGCDPLTFFNTKLFMNLNGCCYLTNEVVKGGDI